MGAIKQSKNLFKAGGLKQDGGTIDKASGNDVPPGALQKEVRDDVDAKLSEGEFVFPADVVRYIGLEKLMEIRDMAKKGLQRMNDIGQMGNAEEVENPEALHDEEEMDDETFSSEVDKVLNNGE
jgi:Arc/MetJ-type ribon-helix-helix transcriptional regulator